MASEINFVRPDLMSTEFGKEIARVGSIQPFLPK